MQKERSFTRKQWKQILAESESENDDSGDEVICVVGSDSEISCSDTENGSCVDGYIEEVMEDCADEDTNLLCSC